MVHRVPGRLIALGILALQDNPRWEGDHMKTTTAAGTLSVALMRAALSGCATGVVPTDKGAFMASKTSAGGAFGDPQALLADLYVEANEHCGKTGQAVETIAANPEAGVPFVRPARTSLQFRCVAK